MKNTIKIVIIAIISTLLLISFNNYSFATNTTNTSDQVSTQAPQSSGGKISTTVSSKTSPENEFFNIGNIINILLIAVGIVLILLAIAILTKLKK